MYTAHDSLVTVCLGKSPYVLWYIIMEEKYFNTTMMAL